MNSLFSKAIFAFVVMTNMSANAQTVNKSAADKLSKAKAEQSARGGVATGGGDLCEDRIQIIRDDLKSWIVKGGAKNLQLPAGISVGKYTDDMIEQIYAAKIRCVANGDAGYPVTVDGAPKVCRFDGSSSSLITCDLKKFEALTEAQQYILVHHEYAGLADIEKPNGSDSNYQVSNQITSNLVSQNVLKLAVTPKTVKNITNSTELTAYQVAALHLPLPDVVYYKDSANAAGASYGLSYFLKRAKSVMVEQSGNVTTLTFDCFGYKKDEKFIAVVTAENDRFVSTILLTQEATTVNAGSISNPVARQGWVTVREVKYARDSFKGSMGMSVNR